MENVAVYGGSFDPPHLGHVMVVTHLLLNDPSVDRVIVMVCYQQTGKNLTNFGLRYDMTQAAFDHLRHRVQVSDLEKKLGGESETLRTMKTLKAEHPDWNLRFVMGSDLLDKCHTWDGWDELKALAPPLPIGRAGISPVAPDQPTPITPLASSTLVREACARKDYKEVSRYVCCGVLDLIQYYGLYVA